MNNEPTIYEAIVGFILIAIVIIITSMIPAA